MTTLSPEHYAFLDKLFPENKWEDGAKHSSLIGTGYSVLKQGSYWIVLNTKGKNPKYKNRNEAKAAARKHQLESIAQGADLSVIPVWRDIESASKDGSEFLAIGKGWRYAHNCYWNADRQSFENPFSNDYMDEPTHWQPLPTPLETEK